MTIGFWTTGRWSASREGAMKAAEKLGPEIILSEGQELRNAIVRGGIEVFAYGGARIIGCQFEGSSLNIGSWVNGKPVQVIGCVFTVVEATGNGGAGYKP